MKGDLLSMYINQGFNFEDYIGETVTIFCACGGESGAGFTGVVLYANECFVRLVTRIGPPPGCALGNACNRNFRWGSNGYSGGNRGGGNSGCINTVGSVVDIPIDRISAFVHNAV